MLISSHSGVDGCSVLCIAVLFEGLGYFILRPVIRVAGTLEFPRRFTVADFVVLAVYIQAVIGFFVQFREPAGDWETWLVLMLLMVTAAIALWGAAVGFLSRAEIQSPVKRLLFLLVLLPATLTLMAALPLLFVLAIMFERTPKQPVFLVPVSGGLVLLFGVAVALRYLGAWIVKDLPPRRSLPESVMTPLPH
jgi:hypothetical protein